MFGKYILWCFLTIITFGIYGWWLEIKMLKWQSKNVHIKTVGEQEAKDNSLWIAIPIAIGAVILFSFVITALGSAIESSNLQFDFKKVFDDSKRNIDGKNTIESIRTIEDYEY